MVVYCKCNNRLKAYDKYCSKCGIKLENTMPEMLSPEVRNYSSLEKMAEDIIISIADGGWPETDAKQYLFEEVMTIFYGKDVFTWINSNS